VTAPAAAVSAAARWTEVRVSCAAEAAESVAEILRDLRGGGLIEDPARAGRAAFRCYLPPSRVLRATLRALRARIRALPRYGLDPGRVTVTPRRVAGRGWATAWRKYARSVRVGRIVIRPTWIRERRRPGDVVVSIDPGMAFGTGMHASTRLALRGLITALDRRPGAAVFDVGTGSGVLAVAAAALGARRVWAVDNDPVATAAARANVRPGAHCRRHRARDRAEPRRRDRGEHRRRHDRRAAAERRAGARAGRPLRRIRNRRGAHDRRAARRPPGGLSPARGAAGRGLAGRGVGAA
jgi:ribosomal protein L11 methylase PrmA